MSTPASSRRSGGAPAPGSTETRTLLRHRLSGSGVARGAFVKLSGLEPLDLLLGAGAAFCVLDLEHSTLGQHEAFTAIAYARAIGLPCLVRLPDVDAGTIGRYLDAGAAGIQIADVTDRATAEALVASARYPPGGERGVSPSQRDGGYGDHGPAGLVAGRAGLPILVAQIERDLGTAVLRDIATSGVDVLFLGPADLSLRLPPGRGIAEVARDLRAAAAGSPAVLGEHAGAAPSLGDAATYVTATTDLTALRDGLVRALSAPPDAAGPDGPLTAPRRRSGAAPGASRSAPPRRA